MAHKECFSLVLGARGRLVLPARLRKRLELAEGDPLVLVVGEDGRMRLSTFRDGARRCRGLLRGVAAGRSLAEELIAERREESKR